MKRGIIQLSDDLLLQWIQFSGGTVVDIRRDTFRNVTEILLEHPEMPEFIDGMIPVPVFPTYIKCQDASGNSVVIREPMVRGTK